MITKATATDNNTRVQIRKILVPIDGSECSLTAAKYATRIAKDENAQLFCIHIIASVPYGYATSATAIDQYFKDINEKVQSWFDKVKNMAKNEGIPGLKTETFTDVKSVIGSIIDCCRSNSHWHQGKNWTKKIFDGKRSKWCSSPCSLSGLTCQIATDVLCFV